MLNDDDLSDDDEGNALERLFICEDYRPISMEIKGISTTTQNEIMAETILLNSTMSSTDHDLTGQIIWPASILLATYILCNNDIIFKENANNITLELGAGCGLGSFLCASFCNKVINTDGNDVVVRLLEKTKTTYQYDKVEVKKLMWGIKSEIKSLSTYPNIIIGADVLLWPNYTRALLLTIKWLMQSSYIHDQNNIPVTYISYIVRANTTTALLFKSAEELELKIDILPLTFLSPEPLCLQSLEKMMLKITLLNLNDIDESSDIIEEEKVKALGFASSPC